MDMMIELADELSGYIESTLLNPYEKSRAAAGVLEEGTNSATLSDTYAMEVWQPQFSCVGPHFYCTI
jgi:hypothetical protein